MRLFSAFLVPMWPSGADIAMLFEPVAWIHSGRASSGVGRMRRKTSIFPGTVECSRFLFSPTPASTSSFTSTSSSLRLSNISSSFLRNAKQVARSVVSFGLSIPPSKSDLLSFAFILTSVSGCCSAIFATS